MRVITPAEWRSQPWRNRGGVTHEVVRWPDRDDYDVRVSVAEVTTSGPFSRFSGYRRWSFLAGPAPIELVQHGVPALATQLVALGDHLTVPGDVALTATLRAGPTRLANVLARPGASAGYGPVGHPVRLALALVERPELPRWSTAVCDPPARLDTTGCVWIA